MIGVAEFERQLPHGSGNGSKDATFEIRKATRSHAFGSPMPGEGRKPERPGQTENYGNDHGAAPRVHIRDGVPVSVLQAAGAYIFTVPKLRDNGAVLGQISFLSGMVCVLIMGLFYGLWVPAAVCGAILALGSVMLYEWTRRTVIDRNFYVGLSGEVPGAVCDTGPYRYVRHPFYLSYMVAFLGVAVAFPSMIVAGVCLINIGLFVYMALDDERVLLRSPLGAEYRAYRGRVGIFVPRFAAKHTE